MRCSAKFFAVLRCSDPPNVPLLRWNYKPLLDFDGLQTIENSQMPATQEQFSQATPSETSPVKDNHLPSTVQQATPSLPAHFFRGGR